MRRFALASTLCGAAAGHLNVLKKEPVDLEQKLGGVLKEDPVDLEPKVSQERKEGEGAADGVKGEASEKRNPQASKREAGQGESMAERLQKAAKEFEKMMGGKGGAKDFEKLMGGKGGAKMWEKMQEGVEKMMKIYKGQGQQGNEMMEHLKEMMKDGPEGKGVGEIQAAAKKMVHGQDADKPRPLFMKMGEDSPLTVFMSGKNQVWVSFDPLHFEDETKKYKEIVENVARKFPDHHFLYYDTKLHQESMEEALGCYAQPCLNYIHLDGSMKDDFSPPVKVYADGLTEEDVFQFVVDAKAGKIEGHKSRIMDNIFEDEEDEVDNGEF